MGKITTGFSMSLDGFVAGANDSPENSLGDAGDRFPEGKQGRRDGIARVGARSHPLQCRR
jgi:hypothetical protein